MTVVFDTETVAVKERVDQPHTALAETSLSSIALPSYDRSVHARLDVWQLGGNYTCGQRRNPAESRHRSLADAGRMIAACPTRGRPDSRSA